MKIALSLIIGITTAIVCSRAYAGNAEQCSKILEGSTAAQQSLIASFDENEVEKNFQSKFHGLYKNAEIGNYANAVERVNAALKDRPDSNQFLNSVLSEADKVAIYGYSCNLFTNLNTQLRNHTLDDSNRAFSLMLRSSLKKLPNYVGYVYRTTRLPAEVMDQIKKDYVFEDAAFFSTTTVLDKSLISFELSGPLLFKIQSKTGKWINPWTGRQYENEVLFAPNTKFKIKSVELMLSGKTIIEMNELQADEAMLDESFRKLQPN